jgi:hypothetical protein
VDRTPGWRFCFASYGLRAPELARHLDELRKMRNGIVHSVFRDEDNSISAALFIRTGFHL